MADPMPEEMEAAERDEMGEERGEDEGEEEEEEEGEEEGEEDEAEEAPSYHEVLNPMTKTERFVAVQAALALCNVHVETDGKTNEESFDLAETLEGGAYANLFGEAAVKGIGPLRESVGHNKFHGPGSGGFGLALQIVDDSVQVQFGKRSATRRGIKSYKIQEPFELVLDLTLAEEGSPRNCIVACLHSYFLLIRFSPNSMDVVECALVGIFDAEWMVTVQVRQCNMCSGVLGSSGHQNTHSPTPRAPPQVCEHQLENPADLDDKFDLPGKATPRPVTFSQASLKKFMAENQANLDYCSKLAEGKASRNVRNTVEPALMRLWLDNWEDTFASKQAENCDYCPVYIGLQDLLRGVRLYARDKLPPPPPHEGLLRNAAGGQTLGAWLELEKKSSAPNVWSPPPSTRRNGGKPAGTAAALQAKAAKAVASVPAPAPALKRKKTPTEVVQPPWGSAKAMSTQMGRIRKQLQDGEFVSKDRCVALLGRFKDHNLKDWSDKQGWTSVLTERDQLYPALLKSEMFIEAQLKAASKFLFEAKSRVVDEEEVQVPKPADPAPGARRKGAKVAPLGDTVSDQEDNSAKRQKVGDQDESLAQIVDTLSNAVKLVRGGDGVPRPVLVSGDLERRFGDLERRFDQLDAALVVQDEVGALKDENGALKEQIHQLKQAGSVSAQMVSALQSDVAELTSLMSAMCGVAATNDSMRAIFAGLVKTIVAGKMKHMQDTTKEAWNEITESMSGELKVELVSLILATL
jgi:hypothetical protein